MKLRPLLVASVAAVLCAAEPSFDPARYLDHIKYLASPEMRGRATGSPELERAAQYIAGKYKEYGLQPADGKSYLQPFPVTTSAKVGKGTQLSVTESGKKRSLALDQEFVPFNFSSKGSGSGPVVFAGYGITAPEFGYDDYAGLDVKGKFVLVLRHEPQEADEHSVFNGKELTDYAQFYSKAVNARQHGAAGVILVNDTYNHPQDKDALQPFGRTEGPNDAGLLFIQVREPVAEQWFRDSGKNLKETQGAIDKDLKPRSFVLSDVQVKETLNVEREVRTVHNVAAFLPGETSEYVIIGAHYDHLGLGEQFSLAPSLAGTVHPGADDNASGTAGVLELARYFAAAGKQTRGMLFLSFAGEELGLLGSSYWVNHPELPLARAVAMINLDMIGRVRDGKLFIGGAGTGTTLRQTLDAMTPHYKLKVDYSDSSGYGSSDHTSFTAHQVPVLFFFSGLHADYHKPSDTWYKIDANSAEQVIKLVAEVAAKLETELGRPQYVRVAPSKSSAKLSEDPHSGTVSGISGSSGSGYGPDFGSIPDFAEPPKGVRFADIRDGSPAAKAGLKGGDVLVRFGDRDIGNLYDFTYALRAHKPGDQVEVEVLRDNKPLRVTVLLTQRK